MEATIFIYKKNNEFKVLNISQARQQEKYLILIGWKHTHTIDSAIFIQYLLNSENVDIVSEFLDLKK